MFNQLTKIVGSVIALGMLASLSWAADVKIAVVDTNDVLGSSSEGKKAQEAVKRKGEELGKDLERRRNELGRQLEEFQKQAAVMKEDARKKKMEELEKKDVELRQKLGTSQQEIAKLEQSELKPLLEKLDRVIKQISKDNKYTLVLDRRVVIDFDPSLDITDKVKSAFGR